MFGWVDGCLSGCVVGAVVVAVTVAAADDATTAAVGKTATVVANAAASPWGRLPLYLMSSRH